MTTSMAAGTGLLRTCRQTRNIEEPKPTKRLLATHLILAYRTLAMLRNIIHLKHRAESHMHWVINRSHTLTKPLLGHQPLALRDHQCVQVVSVTSCQKRKQASEDVLALGAPATTLNPGRGLLRLLDLRNTHTEAVEPPECSD